MYLLKATTKIQKRTPKPDGKDLIRVRLVFEYLEAGAREVGSRSYIYMRKGKDRPLNVYLLKEIDLFT